MTLSRLAWSLFLFGGLSTAYAEVAPLPIPAPVPIPPAPAPDLTIVRKVWPPEVVRVEIPCSDGALQPAMWYAPAKPEKKPLLVALHTWSSQYSSAAGDAIYAEWCLKQGWVFVHPHFRGPNSTPESMGSDRAVQDVVEAVAWAKEQTAVDLDRVYLIGVSGGGHMALQMAGRHPEMWSGVSAWCGISDIAAWHAFHSASGVPMKYAKDIEGALGGSPQTSEELKQEAWRRSPLSSLAAARSVPLDIAAGIHDGRLGSVPFVHSLRAFNAVVGAGPDALPDKEVDNYYETLALPSGWVGAEADPVFGLRVPLFRRVSGNTRVTLFLGGHEIVHQAALNWLDSQRKGQPAVWDMATFIPLDVQAAESGK